MPRKSATRPAEREPASLPEVLVPLSEVPESQRAAYEIELIDNPEEFRKVVSTEDFFQMIQNFPNAWWGERLSMYLYRHEDDGGLMIKNAEGEGKYIKPIIRQAVDRDWIASRNGGGKFQLWLNLSEPGTRRQTTVRKYTFRIDGPPLVKEGQVIELGGKPVSVGAAAPTPQPSETTAQMIAATSAAATSNVELVTKGIASVMEMQTDLTRKQLGLDAPQKDPLDTVKTIIELLRAQQPPAGNSMKDALEIVDRLDAMAARRNPAPVEHEEKETPIENTLSAIKELSGGLSLAELMKPAARAAAADPIAGWAPIVSTIGGVVGQFLEKLPMIQAQRIEAMRLEIHLRQMQHAQPGQHLPQLPAPTPAPAPTPQAAHPQPAQPASPDPAQLMGAIVRTIIAGFKKAPVGEWGEETAAAIGFQFSDAIESLGFADTLGDPAKVQELIVGIPDFAELRKDARWKMFEEDLLSYCANRWGLAEDEKGSVQAIDAPKPPAA
jgi:hypothetical protein